MSAQLLQSNNATYVCDTLPAPKLASDKSCSRSPSPSPSSPPQVTTFDAPILDPAPTQVSYRPSAPSLQSVQATTAASTSAAAISKDAEGISPAPARKLCVRHQRMADEGTNLKLQQALDALPVAEREAVSSIWSAFSSSPHPRRALILQGLLTMCCFSQLSLLTEQLQQLIRIDPFAILPREVSLKILGYLDATSLCRAAQVSRQWKSLADDDILWRGICEQHIGQKCLKCGWGLPILEKRRRAVPLPASPSPSPSLPAQLHPHLKRPHEAESGPLDAKRQRLEADARDGSSRAPTPSSELSSHTVPSASYPSNPLIVPSPSELPPTDFKTRPWKDVYCERLTVERNWRRGRCTVRTLKGHTDGVMCLQFSETLAHPSFPVLITGSYDRTARVWNLETGAEVHSLVGHTRAIRALQFDAVKLITGSMDHTMRVWNWRTGQCLKILEGHTEGVVCLNFDSNVLASGSVDTTVKVWNFRTGECFTLRGHCDWVNAVQLWDSNGTSSGCGGSAPAALESSSASSSSAPHIDPGKMLFSASDDGTIRLWDLSLRTCVWSREEGNCTATLVGHRGAVTCLALGEDKIVSGSDDGDVRVWSFSG
ncbi:WD40 repeat-like protein [Trametes sanguinea]|nr:WD40 repeat-like protein [Trametes sanguinea]